MFVIVPLPHNNILIGTGTQCTKDIVDDSFVPKNRKPKPIPQPAAKPAPKGKHVQLFEMKRKVGKGFYSAPVDGQ